MNNDYPSYFTMSNQTLVDALRDIGTRGEMQLFHFLHARYPNNLLIPNIYIGQKGYGTSEIDLCMISNKALFVFEYKNYSVSVYGNDAYRNWTYYDKKDGAHFFYSPVLQQQSHIQALTNFLPYVPSERIVPIIVFSNRSKIKVSSKMIVCHRCQLPGYITQSTEHFTNELSWPVIERLAEDLLTQSRQPDIVKQQHIEYIKSRHFD